MKKFLTLLLSVILCLSLCACENKKEEYQKAMTYLELGNYQEALIKFVELGNYKDSSEMVRKIKNYQDAMNLLEEGDLEDAYTALCELSDFADVNRMLSKFEFPVLTYVAYDKQNTYRTTREYTYYEGKLSCMTTEGIGKYKQSSATYYQYDAKGNVSAEMEMHLGTSEYTIATEYDYDKDGNKTYEYFWYTGLGVVPGEYYYSYDHSGNLIREEYYTGGGVYYVTTYEYDENGQTVKISKVNYRDNKTETVSYKNEYNNKGQLISRSTEEETTTYEYDENGRLIYEMTEKQKEDSQRSICYEYDTHGNLILKAIEQTTDGETKVYYHAYEYGIMYTP